MVQRAQVVKPLVQPPPAKPVNESDIGRPSGPMWGLTPKTPSERALALGARGHRVPLSLSTFDGACRGGPLTGRVIVIGASPGIGKTTLVTQLARELAGRAVWSAILSADEDIDGLLIRIGQQEGLTREHLEGGDDTARRVLADRLRDLPLLLFDADEDDATIELVAAELAFRADGAPSVLIVDSIQTARADGSVDADTPRARVDAVMAALKRAAKMHRHLVIATSEMSRSWYKSRRDRIDPMAAFKESGGIEYGTSAALAMIPVEGHDDLIDVVVPKNRMGQKVPFRLQLNFARAHFTEIALPNEEQKVEAKQKGVRSAVLELLQKQTNLGSANAVFRVMGGNRVEVLRVVADLVSTGAVVKRDGAYQLALNGGAQ